MSNLDTHAELLVTAVSSYCSAFDLALESKPDADKKAQLWSEIISNLHEAVQILKQDTYGYELLSKWYAQCPIDPDKDIHKFLDALCEHVHDDKLILEVLASNYTIESIWKLIVGIIICIAPPALFIVFIPLLSNPVVIAPLFLLMCVLIPLFGNKLLQAGVNDLNYSCILNQAASPMLSGQNKNHYRKGFFSDPVFAELRTNVVEIFNTSLQG